MRRPRAARRCTNVVTARADLLLVRGVDAGYDGRQVLFGVDIDVKEGEIVALLGTNGAGKSTLLKAISGVVEADRGAVVLDGRDITHAPPNEIAALGISQMPGGQGVFGSLDRSARTCSSPAGRRRRNRRRGATQPSTRCSTMFPVLRDRLHARRRRDLSGGQQQMLALGHGVRRQATGAADRRAVTGPGTGGRRPAAAARASPRRRRRRR